MSTVQTISAEIKKTSFVFVALLPVTIISYLIASTLAGHSNGVDILGELRQKRKKIVQLILFQYTIRQCSQSILVSAQQRSINQCILKYYT